jgi:hypothetical protein
LWDRCREEGGRRGCSRGGLDRQDVHAGDPEKNTGHEQQSKQDAAKAGDDGI